MILSDTLISNIATVTGITAASLIALNLNLFVFAYSLFAFSSVLWSIYAYRNSNNQLLTMNVIFTIINLIGIYRFN